MIIGLIVESNTKKECQKIVDKFNLLISNNKNKVFVINKNIIIKKLKHNILTAPNGDKTAGQETVGAIFFKALLIVTIPSNYAYIAELNKKLIVKNCNIKLKFLN